MRTLLRSWAIWVVVLVAACCFMDAVTPHTASASVNLFGDPCRADSSSPLCGANGSDNISGTNGIILRAASLLSIIAGITAVIMIMLAGIMFVTAAGDSSKISTAKKTLTYAIVGLIVIVLARTIVIFVVSRV